jgi:hypothetical protein
LNLFRPFQGLTILFFARCPTARAVGYSLPPLSGAEPAPFTRRNEIAIFSSLPQARLWC